MYAFSEFIAIHPLHTFTNTTSRMFLSTELLHFTPSFKQRYALQNASKKNTGFGCRSRVHEDMRLPEKQLFGLPVTLDLPEVQRKRTGTVFVEMEVFDVYENLV